MKTLYIDIYFLINFTIDALALYFSIIFLATPSSAFRIIITSLLGAVFATALIFLPEAPIFEWGLFCLLVVLTMLIAVEKISLIRRIKLAVTFLLFEMIIGGAVQFFYNMLEKYLAEYFELGIGEVNNRRIILLALTVLVVILVLKLTLNMFTSGISGKSASVEITFLGKSVRVDALCDSGNLAKDPMDKSFVIFVKKKAIKPLFEYESNLNFEKMDVMKLFENQNIKRKMRMIPVKKDNGTKMYIGMKPDDIKIITKRRSESVVLTVAIDEDGGTYGGYSGLLPTAVLTDVL